MLHKQIPNILTVLRMILTVFFLFFYSLEGFKAKLIATAIFILASLTDFLDGYLARKYHLISNFGKIMDPIADKCLMLSAFWVFSAHQIILPWMFIVIFLREFSVTLARLVAIKQGRFQAAERSGKIKTIAQFVAVYMMLFFVLFRHVAWSHSIADTVDGLWFALIQGLMLIVVVLTLYSGFEYFRNSDFGPDESNKTITS